MMKRSRKELKAIAKRALLGNYGTVVGSTLLSYLMLFAMAIPLVVFIFIVSLQQHEVFLFIGFGIWYLLMIAAAALFVVGTARICYQVCIGQAARLGDLLYGFKNHPLRFLGLSLFVGLISLLSSVPGILLMLWGELGMAGAAGIVIYLAGMVLVFLLSTIVTLRYSLAVYVLLEEPERKVWECIRLSRDMTDGNKMRLFQLQLSFIGVELLSYLTFGLGSLWVLPYTTSTTLCCYLSIKEEKYRREPAPYEADGIEKSE